MKKRFFLFLTVVCILALTACFAWVEGHAVYEFPEQIQEICVIESASDWSITYTFTQEDKIQNIVQWYYDLKLRETKREHMGADGNNVFRIFADGELAVTYDNNGDRVYVYKDGKKYIVRNPSNPPLE